MSERERERERERESYMQQAQHTCIFRQHRRAPSLSVLPDSAGPELRAPASAPQVAISIYELKGVAPATCYRSDPTGVDPGESGGVNMG